MRVLVLDPSSMSRRFIREELEWGEYVVHEAASTEEARRILRTEPGIAVMTTSMVLDDMEGFEFLAGLHEPGFQEELARVGNENVIAVFVTSNDNDADRLRGYHVGAADFIEKPWPRGQLLAHVNSLLGRSTEMQDLDVLVVDDSRSIRRFVRSGISRLGARVHEADDGDTAWRCLQERDIDLVVTDLNMARMGGDELCLKIRGDKRLADLPVIFLSANEDARTILTLFTMGATDYLAKPCIQEELMARIRGHLERELLLRALREVSGIDSDDSIAAVVGQDAAGGPAPEFHVLLVDDSEVNLAIGRKLLAKLGCRVTTATSGRQAVDMFARSRRRPCDLVLMDLLMPHMDGLDATRRIRRLETELAAADPAWGKPVPIVALTSADEDQQLTACLQAGMNDFVGKPFRVDKVRFVLDRWAQVPV